MDNKTFDVDRRSPAETYCVEQGVALKVNVGRDPSGDLFPIWMNGDDLLETITFDPKFYLGGGYYNGPNTICRCGSVVGSLYTDCCDAHRFQTDPKSTYWTELLQSDPVRLELRYSRNRALKNRR